MQETEIGAKLCELSIWSIMGKHIWFCQIKWIQ